MLLIIIDIIKQIAVIIEPIKKLIKTFVYNLNLAMFYKSIKK